MTASCSLEAIILKLREAKHRHLIEGYIITERTIRISLRTDTQHKTKLALVGHIHREYGYTTHLTPDFYEVVVHLFYR